MLWFVLSLIVLTLFLVGLALYILHGMSLRVTEIERTNRLIQRMLNSFDQPESLSASGVAPGSSWLATDQEMTVYEERLRSESRQRAGSGLSRRISPMPTG